MIQAQGYYYLEHIADKVKLNEHGMYCDILYWI